METINIKKEDNEAEVKISQEIHDENVEKRYNEIMSIASECIQPEELKLKLLQKRKLICYDGFEPSGRMHIAQGKKKKKKKIAN